MDIKIEFCLSGEFPGADVESDRSVKLSTGKVRVQFLDRQIRSALMAAEFELLHFGLPCGDGADLRLPLNLKRLELSPGGPGRIALP